MIFHIIVGGIIGWLASVVMRTDAPQAIILNIVAAMIGSFLGGWLLRSSVSASLLMGWVGALLGAVILLTVMHLARRVRLR